ncbi:hypothetical protein MMC13_000748 [Lambiella insularis]|nr:hypothetical protein [Lambiella insularis]
MKPTSNAPNLDDSVALVTSPLLRLPGELRQMIYELVLCSPLQLVDAHTPERQDQKYSERILRKMHHSYPAGTTFSVDRMEALYPSLEICTTYFIDMSKIRQFGMAFTVDHLKALHPFLKTCKTIYNEAISTFRQCNTFHLHLNQLRYQLDKPVVGRNSPHWFHTQLTSLLLTMPYRVPSSARTDTPGPMSLLPLKHCSALHTLQLAIGYYGELSSNDQAVLDMEELKEIVVSLSKLRVFELWRHFLRDMTPEDPSTTIWLPSDRRCGWACYQVNEDHPDEVEIVDLLRARRKGSAG